MRGSSVAGWVGLPDSFSRRRMERTSRWPSSVESGSGRKKLSSAKVRPLAGIPARPDSRGPYDVTATAHERPGSAVRPLSGNVFMRRSSKHGWVAKAYPQGSSLSQTNLDVPQRSGADDNLRSESLDSFFDDDFEDEGKLGNLLACNTLGVEKKAAKQDWVSGEIDIPRFHCPRCRDHWYGITSEPCDEELARLIREGLWDTGNRASEADRTTKTRERSLRSAKGSGREIQAYESGSSTKLPSVRSQFSLHKREDGNSSWHLRRGQDGEEKKKKKRITFDLNHDGDGVDSGSHQEDEVGRASGAREANGMEGKGGSDDGEGRGSDETGAGGKDGGGGGGGEGEGQKGGRDSEDGVGEGTGTGGRLKRGREHSRDGEGRSGGDRRGNGNSGSDTALLGGGAEDSKLKGDGTTRGQRTGLGGGDQVGGLGGLGSGKEGMVAAGGTGQRSGLGGRGVLEGGGGGKDGRGLDGLGVGGDLGGQGSEGHGGGSSGGGGVEKDGQAGRDRFGARRASKGGAGARAAAGGNNGSKADNAFLKPTDHGKRIRKSGGYMRAVSPTSSEWGDPLHARSFLSSTAASCMGSTSDLTGDANDGSESPDPTSRGNGKQFLPPIVHPIPPPVSMHYLSGPEITRPWTFSYH